MSETSQVVARPEHVPEKFWDATTGSLRTEALLKSYLELEKRLSAPPPPPGPEPDPAVREAEAWKLLGVPDGPEGYCIRCDHGLFTPDPELNARLHAARFTPNQAQLLYDLAAEKLPPMLGELAAEYEAERELEKLAAHFGGPEKWAEASRQIQAWARANLPADVVEALARTAEGVLTLRRMMAKAEPDALSAGDGEATSEVDLHRMVRDPRYWRDRDPTFIAKVTDGFRRVYTG